MEVHDHDHAGLHGDSEQRDVSYPNRHTEVVTKPVLKDQASGHGVKRWKNEDGRFYGRMKNHVEKNENHKEYDGHDDLQSCFRTQLELIFSGPFVGITRRQFQFFMEQTVRLRDEATVVFRGQIEIDVTRQQTFFIADHCRSAAEV